MTAAGGMAKAGNGAKAAAEFLRTNMAAQNMSQNELARRTGIAQAQISRLLQGTHAPRTSTLERLAPAFGVSVSKMLQGASATKIRTALERLKLSEEHAVLSLYWKLAADERVLWRAIGQTMLKRRRS